MIVERATFQAKYGSGDALVEVIREFVRTFGGEIGDVKARLYTDRTGRMFTVTWDQEFASMAAYTAASAKEEAIFGRPEFARWFAKMQPLVEHGERQLLTAVDI